MALVSKLINQWSISIGGAGNTQEGSGGGLRAVFGVQAVPSFERIGRGNPDS